MAVVRPITVGEAYNRMSSGPKVDENEWNFKTTPTHAAEMAKEYDIDIPMTEFVPEDKSLRRNLFEAGLHHLLEMGIYNIDTHRVAYWTEDEILESLKLAPRRMELGEGKDKRVVTPRNAYRTVRSHRWPCIGEVLCCNSSELRSGSIG